MSLTLPEMEIVDYRGVKAAYWREGGQSRRISLRTSDAGEARRQLEALRARLQRVALNQATIGDVYQSYMDDKEKLQGEVPQTAFFAWRVLASFWKDYAPDNVTRELCREYIGERRALGRKDGTIRRELVQLAAAVRWANPKTTAVFEYPPQSQPRDLHMSKAQFISLREGAIVGGSPHIALFVEVARATGARAGAILDLRWSQVDLARQIITLIRKDQDPDAIMGKRYKPRAVVPFSDRMKEILEDAQRAAMTDFVIEFAGGPIGSVKKSFAASVRRAGLPKWVTPHIVRHSVAVWMAEDGVPMSEIAQYLGHTSTRETERTYARYSPNYLRKAMASVDF
ncbi:tyrosine-type recombinase/integrase [Salipiger pacificus]|nr:tyrosine-type recombinase/integrase [Alloyangia pacifica]